MACSISSPPSCRRSHISTDVLVYAPIGSSTEVLFDIGSRVIGVTSYLLLRSAHLIGGRRSSSSSSSSSSSPSSSSSSSVSDDAWLDLKISYRLFTFRRKNKFRK